MAPDAERGLRRTLRSEFEQLEPGLRVLAEDFLGLEANLDLLAADAEGRLVLALVAEPGRELEGIASAMAQAEFCAPRVRDWQKLAPDLPLRPEGLLVRYHRRQNNRETPRPPRRTFLSPCPLLE